MTNKMATEIRMLTSVDQFDKLLADSAASDGRLVVVHFHAPWAAQCQQIDAVLIELGKDQQLQRAGVQFARLEAESLPVVSHRFDIKAVPTCVLIKNKVHQEKLTW